MVVDFSSSTPGAQLASPFGQEGFWEDDAGGMWMQLPSARWYLLCSEPEVYKDDPRSDMGSGCFFLVL